MTTPRWNARIALPVALVIGLVIRLVVMWNTAGLDTKIVDEQHYRQLAENILAGNGFAWGPGQPTSIRPPLYPGLLALSWRIVGGVDLQAIRLLQIGLALLTTALVYGLGTSVFGSTVGRYAAVVFWLYPSFIFFNLLILTETVFTLLLVAFVYFLVRLVHEPHAGHALLAGICLGAAALTRSVLWPLPLLLCPLLVLMLPGTWLRRTGLALVLLAGYLGVVVPWAVRNTRVQGTLTIVDTMGGINLRLGNYEFTPDDRMWDGIALGGPKGWSHELVQEFPGAKLTEGEKEKWAQRKALEYIRQHPMETARRSFIKFADFWGLEREYVAGVRQGLYASHGWLTMIAIVAIGGSYPLVVMLGFLGIWKVPPKDRRDQILLLMPIVVITGIHVIVFGHSRYHLPLVPILGIYAAAFLVHLRAIAWTAFPYRTMGAAATCAVLLAVWVRQIIVVDLERLKSFFQHVS